MKSRLMKKLKIKYEKNITNTTKLCITRMIVNRKCVLTKLINKRAEKSHQKKTITKRTSALPDRIKKKKSICHVPSNESIESVWYMWDGVCDGFKTVVPNEFNSYFYMKKQSIYKSN